jgi:GT2 family glycosyltransferase
MNAPAPVAVGIVNWNSGALLQRCLRAVAAQAAAPRRVIVFDNASSDGSARAAAQEFPGVEFVHHDRNAGFAWANNHCVARCADCEWVLLLNPDAFPEPDCVERLLAAASAHPGVAAFAPLILRDAGPGEIDSAGDDYLRSGIAVHRLHGRARAAAGAGCEVFSACGAAALYRRDAFLAVSGFDESLFAFYEDVDLGLRLRLAGQRARFVPDAVVRHVGGGTTGGANSALSAYYGQRNFIAVYFRNMPGPLFWRGLPAHLWAVARGIGKGMLSGNGVAVIRGTLEALARLPGIAWARHRARRPDAPVLASLEQMVE